MRDAWSGTMTLVIWLDAQDSILLARIRNRNRGHPCEALNDDEALAWLGRYRTAFESSLSIIRQLRPTDLVRFDTSSMSPDEIAESLIELIETRGG
jgi:RNase adaptor protein for sRNA GlmZ degradation